MSPTANVSQSLTNLVSKRAKFILDFETVGFFWVDLLCDEISSLVFRRVKNRSNFPCKQTRIRIFRARKPEPNFFPIDPK